MRPMRLGLLAALIIAVMAPAVAMAATPKAPEVKISPESRKTGMADAPALISAAGLTCQLSDARLVGKAPPDKKTGSLGSSLYEVACSNGPGFLVQTSTAAPLTFSCILVNYPADPAVKPGNPCLLPTNLDLMPSVVNLAAKAKVPCTPDTARGIGATPKNTIIEVACPGGSGYIILAGVPLDINGASSSTNCLAYDVAEGNVKCTLKTPAERLATIDHYAQVANNGCTAKDRRFVGLFTDGTEGYEVACNNGKGYIYKVDSKGAVVQTLDCAKEGGSACTLTDSRAASAEQAGLYTKLAKNAGSSCTVTRYAVFPASGDKEIVELVCGDGAGAIGMFPATGKGTVLDCGHALLAGYKCTLGKADYAGLTADLRKFDKKECTVSSTGAPLKAPDGSMRLEVACSDGLPGYMIQYADPQTPKEAVACSFAGNCVLPTNKKKG
jgi:hypothetical protein